MVSYLLSVMVVAATITCEISGQEKYQEHLTSGERESKCQSQQAAGRRHADVLRCSFQVDVNNFHVQFYPEGSFNKNVPDMDVVVSCSSSCEIPEAFKDYIFINQSVFHSSEDHTYTFDVLPSKTTNGSFMCQAFHEADTLYTDFCNVSDHILLTNLTGVLPHESSPRGHQEEPTKESNSTTASPTLLLLLLLLLLLPVIAVPVAVWKISRKLSDRHSDVEQSNSGNVSPDSQGTPEITQTTVQTESEEDIRLLSRTDEVSAVHREQKG